MKYLSTSYCLSNKFTKNYCIRTILVQVIVKDVVAFFETVCNIIISYNMT